MLKLFEHSRNQQSQEGLKKGYMKYIYEIDVQNHMKQRPVKWKFENYHNEMGLWGKTQESSAAASRNPSNRNLYRTITPQLSAQI